jgi:hypothetical protein
MEKFEESLKNLLANLHEIEALCEQDKDNEVLEKHLKIARQKVLKLLQASKDKSPYIQELNRHLHEKYRC